MLKINSFDEIRAHLDVPAEAIAFLKSITEETENGRYPFSPDCFINVMNCTTKAEITPEMEAHDVFIDIQCAITGEEKMLYTNREGLSLAKPYIQEKDFMAFYFDTYEEVVVKSGECAVFFPCDAHLPGRAVAEPLTMKKAVIKLRYKA